MKLSAERTRPSVTVAAVRQQEVAPGISVPSYGGVARRAGVSDDVFLAHASQSSQMLGVTTPEAAGRPPLHFMLARAAPGATSHHADSAQSARDPGAALAGAMSCPVSMDFTLCIRGVCSVRGPCAMGSNTRAGMHELCRPSATDWPALQLQGAPSCACEFSKQLKVGGGYFWPRTCRTMPVARHMPRVDTAQRPPVLRTDVSPRRLGREPCVQAGGTSHEPGAEAPDAVANVSASNKAGYAYATSLSAFSESGRHNEARHPAGVISWQQTRPVCAKAAMTIRVDVPVDYSERRVVSRPGTSMPPVITW